MDESNIVVSAYTIYRHLQQYCSHPSNQVDKICVCRPVAVWKELKKKINAACRSDGHRTVLGG